MKRNLIKYNNSTNLVFALKSAPLSEKKTNKGRWEN